MYERKYGDKYDKALTVKEIAARIRGDVKAAIATKRLPRVTVSVRMRARAIDVRVKGLPFSLFDETLLRLRHKADAPAAWGLTLDETRAATNDLHYRREVRRSHRDYADETVALLGKLREIHRAYNHDGSDAMTDYFDVKYYGDVAIDWEYERDELGAAVARLDNEAVVARHDRERVGV